MSSVLTALAFVVLQVPPATPATPSPVVMDGPFQPDTVLAVLGTPRIVLLNSVDGRLAALQLFVPLVEGPAEAGTGQVLRDLAMARMRGLAGPVGAHVSATRTPWGMTYSVEGAAADLEYLTYLLHEAVAEPEMGFVALELARQSLADAVSRAAETPAGALLASLREAAAPDLPPVHGTPGTVATLDAARVREVWWRSHAPDDLTLVVAAPVVPEVVLAAAKGMGAVGSPGGGPLDAPAPTSPRRSRPQALRTWYGEAFVAGAPSDPMAAVVAELVAAQLESRPNGVEGGVQLLSLRDRWLLVIAGAAFTRDAQGMRDMVSQALARTRAALTPETVRQAVLGQTRSVLFAARTPEGLVSQVGRGLAITGSPDAAQDYLEALSAIHLESLAAYLDGLIESTPAKAEVLP
jgi:predicted Zn-dependent peptidase